MWIQRMSGTLSGFSVPSAKHGAQRSKDSRARPFGVNQRGLGSQVWRRWSSCLPPVSKFAGIPTEIRSL